MDLSPNGSQDESAFPTPQSSLHLDFDGSACKRLITHDFSGDEIIPLIGNIFTSEDEVKLIGYLRAGDAQAFIDVLDEALDRVDLPPRLRRKCLSALCKICGRQALLPRTLKIPLCYDRSDTPLYHGGYADVWKGEHKGRKVAVKVLRVYSTSDFEKITNKFCKEVVTWKALRHPNVLPLLGVMMEKPFSLFAMASEWMVNGNINEFIKAHQDVNRFELLKDVTRGLIYMHSQAMIHGDLKGANILIDQDRHACLADFGLLTIVSDPTNPTASSSSAKGGTTRWMSPELLDPDHFGIKDGRPTKESDSYALGMVILEVLSGHAPFNLFRDVIVMRIVLEGKRPERPNGPEGVWFTDDLWQILTLCWDSQRKNRPTIEAILVFLEGVSGAWKPPSLPEDVEMAEDEWDLTTVSDSSEACPPDPQAPLTDPPEEEPPKGVTVMKALPTVPPSYSVERSGEITVYDESVPYITTPPITDTPVEFISVELSVLAPRLSMRFELSLNAPTSLRLPRGAKPVRGLEKWRGELEISHDRVKSAWGNEGLWLIGAHGMDEPCMLAKTGDSLTVWAVPDELVSGVSIQSAKVLYGML